MSADTGAGTPPPPSGREGSPTLLGSGDPVGWRAMIAGREQWLVAGVGGITLLALSRESSTVLCPFRRCTGGYCPFCGATRSLGAAIRLEPMEALRLHPLLPLMALLAIAMLVPQNRGLGLFGPARSRRIMSVGVVVIGLTWVVRLALGDIPRPTGLRWPW